MTDEIEVVRGSGDLFSDFGDPNRDPRWGEVAVARSAAAGEGLRPTETTARSRRASSRCCGGAHLPAHSLHPCAPQGRSDVGAGGALAGRTSPRYRRGAKAVPGTRTKKVHHPPQIQKYFIVINQFPQSHRLLTRRGQVIMVRAVLKGRATGTASGAQGS
jgi:hypothetical protein